jgi:hypothetical protein
MEFKPNFAYILNVEFNRLIGYGFNVMILLRFYRSKQKQNKRNNITVKPRRNYKHKI